MVIQWFVCVLTLVHGARPGETLVLQSSSGPRCDNSLAFQHVLKLDVVQLLPPGRRRKKERFTDLLRVTERYRLTAGGLG